MRREHLTDALVLLAVTASAFALRAWHFGEPSLWWDELVEVITASRSLPDVVRDVRLGIPPGFGNTGAMPLDYVLLHFHLALVPMPAPEHLEAYFRFPSLLWSVAAVAAVHACCRSVFDRTVALVASLWLAFSVAHVLYAAEVRFYALMTLMTVLQLWAFAALVARPTLRSWIVYAIVNVLYLLTGLFGACLPSRGEVVTFPSRWRRSPGVVYPRVGRIRARASLGRRSTKGCGMAKATRVRPALMACALYGCDEGSGVCEEAFDAQKACWQSADCDEATTSQDEVTCRNNLQVQRLHLRRREVPVRGAGRRVQLLGRAQARGAGVAGLHPDPITCGSAL